MALDQVHELNNEKIKGVSGAKHVLNRIDISGMERWETCSPEIARIIENFEDSTISNSDTEEKHGDTLAFQSRFASDVKNLLDGMKVDPFEQKNHKNQ